ncbi:tetratricopeptide repeat protein [Pseudonocardia acaciae]|uniref:tetratricopeptide repeat protein n=1 Tax=Pseudonocardia acaciae TaxID=551276 RepID=UPI00146FFD3E|nr:tetratricopeptide repeat protein [Pseudonocardia acaciae]
MEQHLGSETGSTRVAVLSGLGGAGKSQVAVAYARGCSDEVDLEMWVVATSRESIISTYAEAAAALGHAGTGDAVRAAEWFLSWLQHTDRAWLIVLDDLADPADLQGLWPDGSRGRVLITTRRTDAVLSAHGRRRIDIGVFSPDQACAYLAAKLEPAVTPQPANEIAGLVEALHHLPLALAQAAAFILDRDDTCGGYAARFADRRRSLVDLFPRDALADDYRTTIAVTWSLSVDAADQLAPGGMCRPVLQVASVLDPHGFPSGLLETEEITEYVGVMAAAPSTPLELAAASPQDCRDALRNLARFSLLTINPSDPQRAVSVHPLVQRATIEQLTEEHLDVLAQAAGLALSEYWPTIERDPRLGQVLRANTGTLADRHTDALWRGAARSVLLRAGRSLGESGLVTAAVDHTERMVREARRILGPEHPDTLTAENDLGCWQGEAGDITTAINTLTSAFYQQDQFLGHDHPNTLMTRANLGHWRGMNGNPQEAVRWLEQALQAELCALDPHHHTVLATRAYLAHWRGETGDADGAARLYLELHADQQRSLGPDDPDTLRTRNNAIYWLGVATGAPESLEELLAHQERVLGRGHPDTFATRNNIIFLHGEDDPRTAATSWKRLLEDQQKVLDPQHPSIFRTRNNLAVLRGNSGDAAGALQDLEELLAEQRHSLPQKHPYILETMVNIAYFTAETGDAPNATRRFEEVVTLSAEIHGFDHDRTIDARTALAYWRSRAGQQHCASLELNQLLADCLQWRGPNNPRTRRAERLRDLHSDAQDSSTDH